MIKNNNNTGYMLSGTDTESVHGRYRGTSVHGNHRKQNRYRGNFSTVTMFFSVPIVSFHGNHFFFGTDCVFSR